MGGVSGVRVNISSPGVGVGLADTISCFLLVGGLLAEPTSRAGIGANFSLEGGFLGGQAGDSIPGAGPASGLIQVPASHLRAGAWLSWSPALVQGWAVACPGAGGGCLADTSSCFS